MSDDDILQARVSGQSVQSIARLFKTSVASVNKVLDEYALELLQEPNLRRSLMLEVTRLDQMLMAFYVEHL